MRKILLTFIAAIVALGVSAQTNKQVNAKWTLSDPAHLDASTVTGDPTYTSFLSTSFTKGDNVTKTEAMAKSSADTGLTPVEYDTAFTCFSVDKKVTAKTTGHSFSVSVSPKTGHKFKPTKISLDAAKVGTDGGNFDVYIKQARGAETLVASGVAPLRNKITSSNSTGCSHHEFIISDFIVDGAAFVVTVYFYGINGTTETSPKSIAFRNIEVQGVVDEEILNTSHYISALSCKDAEGKTINLLDLAKEAKYGNSLRYPTKLHGNPTDFAVTAKDGYTASVEFADKTATVTVKEGESEVFFITINFSISIIPEKPKATPLKRGLIALHSGSNNLVSWRHRASDDQGVKYKLYTGTDDNPSTALYNGLYIIDKTNFTHTGGSVSSRYKLEVYDKYGNLLETEISGKTWANQSMTIPVEGPVDTKNGALYNPNDASFCDMDGDGEYEIILKWSPSNEKDAASSGTTSNIYFDCLKLDGTRLWRIDMGQNFFASAHTMQFIAWDFDGDGYGEFMAKTAPGTVDGQGNFVLLGNDDPYENLKSSRGKQDHGSEYITVFDGMTGAELATIPYHTDYAKGLSYWGDSNQNRSERYLAALAYLDGYDQNPSPIFARGYYSGAFVGAYDWDGKTLKERWVSRNTTSGQGLWGEGAHWIAVADCDDDGKQEIIYGSAALDHDGKLLYRTGLGHGDALHVSDFITDRPGLEVLMCHEEGKKDVSGFGIDIRDAKTGEILLRQEEKSDTGRGLAAHFDSSQPSAQFLTSARPEMYNMADGSVNGEKWALGSSGAGINCRIYWNGDLYDEFFDKSIIAHWNPSSKSFDRYQISGSNYLPGTLNNGSKNNPCVLGDLLGDWREELVTHDGTFDKSTGAVSTVAKNLIITATNYASNFRLPHLMDDPQYRVQIVNQNCCYNQPPHLSFDPSIKYAGNPNKAKQEDEDPTGIDNVEVSAETLHHGIFTLQGVKINTIKTPGMYIINGKKMIIK